MNSRNKGKRGERQWRDELRENGYPARRGQQFAGGADSPDVVCDGLPWAHFEVKLVEHLNLSAAMAQARRDANGKAAFLAHRKNFWPWLVTMEAERFYRLLRHDLTGDWAAFMAATSTPAYACRNFPWLVLTIGNARRLNIHESMRQAVRAAATRLAVMAHQGDDADLLQRWAGLALFGYNLPQRLLIVDGTPNGGKGTLVRIVQALVGLVNTYQLRTDCLDARFETYRYRGKTLLIGPDVRGDFLMEKGANKLKTLVGGDPLSGEGKGLNGDFPMFGTFNVVVTCNSRLRVRLEGDVGAWRRRLLVVRYEKPAPAKRVLDFDHILLREEGSGILRWALAGFVKLQAEFAQTGDFLLSDGQRERVDSLLAESESLRLFVKASLARHEHDNVTSAEISQAYAEFCADKGWNALPTSVVERTLPDLMLELFHVTKSHSIERDGKKSNRGWRGVRLNVPSPFRLVEEADPVGAL